MRLFEQTIPQLEAGLADAKRAFETLEDKWMEYVVHWPTDPTYVRLNDALVAAIALVKHHRKALKRAKKAAGKVSDESATMSAGFEDEPSEQSVEEQRLVALMNEMNEFIATARRSGFIIEGIRYDPSLVGETDA